LVFKTNTTWNVNDVILTYLESE